MRKVLFRVLIVVLIALLFVLGIAFYQDKTPLAVLQNWFGVQTQQVVIKDVEESTAQTKQDTTSQIKAMVAGETGATDSIEATKEAATSNKLSDTEKQETKQLIDSLFKK